MLQYSGLRIELFGRSKRISFSFSSFTLSLSESESDSNPFSAVSWPEDIPESKVIVVVGGDVSGSGGRVSIVFLFLAVEVLPSQFVSDMFCWFALQCAALF